MPGLGGGVRGQMHAQSDLGRAGPPQMPRPVQCTRTQRSRALATVVSMAQRRLLKVQSHVAH